MASSSSSTHQKGVSYEPTKDCSMGLCSVYCPQWCYLLLPPPPPPPYPPRPHLDLLLPSDPSSSSSFSPLVIAIIGVLASSVLLLAYYALVSDRCGAAALLRRLLLPPPPPPPPRSSAPADSEARRASAATPSRGIDEALIGRIRVCSYKKAGEGSEQCSVCLSEFQEEERLRLLPACGHAFHVQCIDAWLKSHSNCPLCRATILVPEDERSGEDKEEEEDQEEEEGGEEVVAVVEGAEELEFVGEEEEEEEEATSAGNSNGEGSHHLKLDGARSTARPETQHRGAVSIADVLRMSMDDDISAANHSGLLATGISSSGGRVGRGEH
ncbi:E3 ubiquitin-protein ligase Os04g0590900 [Ananas comosus]|uniref:RING-type E3 ubiquitin transferase n=1 Tax=Ananas comosus TaxID=4615 RepID=A0A6P5FPI7_ANACO|nr:E3 ubiquitin-protein ligase Os04g0590900 [Ananas comosus]